MQATTTVPPLSVEVRQKALRSMMEIRAAEERIQGLFLENLVRGSTHLCIGQEACSAGVAAVLEAGDTVTCTYRGHGHALAMGMPIKDLMAEMMGKASGANSGKGGSMHMTNGKIGLLGANAIVAAQLPISVGAALTAQTKKTRNIAITFFGEGAINIGAFHESLNLAAVWKLPVLFICENNLYGEYSPMHATTAVDDVAERAAAYHMPGIIVDGQDVEAVYAEVKKMADRARDGGGPALIELKTYRYRGHSRTDPATYRKPGELDAWLKRDPINLLKDKMIADGQIDEVEYEELKGALVQMVEETVDWAKAEPFPPMEAMYQNIYYEG